jgi:hypothetical protein
MMAAGDADRRPHLLVVGGRDSRFVQEAARLADQCGLAVTPCDDIYSAAAELARTPERFLAVAGLFQLLATCQGDFFALAQRRGVACCCLLDAGRDVDRRRVPAAVRRGVHVIGDPAEVREFLEARLAAAGRPPREQDDPSAEDCRPTDAEIKALLEQETDE